LNLLLVVLAGKNPTRIFDDGQYSFAIITDDHIPMEVTKWEMGSTGPTTIFANRLIERRAIAAVLKDRSTDRTRIKARSAASPVKDRLTDPDSRYSIRKEWNAKVSTRGPEGVASVQSIETTALSVCKPGA
jgi:hypothetical protein